MTRRVESIRRLWLLSNHAVAEEEERIYLRRGMTGRANRSSHICVLIFSECFLSPIMHQTLDLVLQSTGED